MTISRRNFLREGTLVGLSTIATLSLAKAAFGQESISLRPRSGITPLPDDIVKEPLYKLTKALFTGLVYTTFTFNHPTRGKIETYLKSVEDLTPKIFQITAKAGSGIECFNLVFACQSDIELGQGTYTIDHTKIGRFDLFIVPGTKQRYGRDYGALINRLYP
jgi:hypothetical protein